MRHYYDLVVWYRYPTEKEFRFELFENINDRMRDKIISRFNSEFLNDEYADIRVEWKSVK